MHMSHWTSACIHSRLLEIREARRLTMVILEIPTFHSPAFSHYLTQYDSPPNARRESHTSYLNCDPSWISIFLRVIERVQDRLTDKRGKGGVVLYLGLITPPFTPHPSIWHTPTSHSTLYLHTCTKDGIRSYSGYGHLWFIYWYNPLALWDCVLLYGTER